MTHQTPHLDLAAMIEGHMQRAGLAPTQFGKLAAGDPNLVGDIKNGRELRRKTVSRIMEFMLTGKTYLETKEAEQ